MSSDAQGEGVTAGSIQQGVENRLNWSMTGRIQVKLER